MSRFAAIILCGLVLANTSVAQSAKPAAGEKYALLVGVREYPKSSLRRLDFAERDVEDLAKALRDAGFPDNNVRVLTQTRGRSNLRLMPDADNIRVALDLVLKGRTPNDTVLIALSGHGIQLRGSQEHYFCPMDAKLDKRETLIPLRELYDKLEDKGERGGCKAKVKLLFVDACRNDPGQDAAKGTESVTRPELPPPPGGIAAVFSCSRGQVAFEDRRLGHGVFFHYLIEGLNGAADLDGDKEVDLLELQQYAAKHVNAWAQANQNQEQLPELLGQVRGRVTLRKLHDVKQGVVVGNGPGCDFSTIGAAVRSVAAGGQIRVRPGTYNESLLLDKPVEIIGDGPRAEIVVESRDGSCVTITTQDAHLRGLTLRCRAGGADKKVASVAVATGHLMMDDCDVTGDSLACLSVTGKASTCVARKCRLHDGKEAGVSYFAGSHGTLEGCEIEGMALSGVFVTAESTAIVRDCRIHECHGGSLISLGGKGTFENCDVYKNVNGGIEIRDLSECTLRKCRVHDQDTYGLNFHDRATGMVEDCDLYGNGTDNVVVTKEAKPTLRRCKMYDAAQGGINVSDKGMGLLEDCDVYANALSGVMINADGDPTLRGCKIHDNKKGSVFVYQKGHGTLEDCDVFASPNTGIEITGQSDLIVRKCRIQRNAQIGVWVHEKSTATITDCDLTGNGLGAWRIDEGCVVKRRGNRE